MAKKEAIYSYHHDPSIFTSRYKLSNILIATLIVGVISYNIAVELLVVPVVLLLVLMYLKQNNTNKILVDNKFFIFKSNVYYYSRISSVKVNQDKGIANFFLNSGEQLVILQEYFPTGAQKEDKIRLNKMRTFNKVVGKIITKARNENPNIVFDITEI